MVSMPTWLQMRYGQIFFGMMGFASSASEIMTFFNISMLFSTLSHMSLRPVPLTSKIQALSYASLR